jgi:hypothetical protein
VAPHQHLSITLVALRQDMELPPERHANPEIVLFLIHQTSHDTSHYSLALVSFSVCVCKQLEVTRKPLADKL